MAATSEAVAAPSCQEAHSQAGLADNNRSDVFVAAVQASDTSWLRGARSDGARSFYICSLNLNGCCGRSSLCVFSLSPGNSRPLPVLRQRCQHQIANVENAMPFGAGDPLETPHEGPTRLSRRSAPALAWRARRTRNSHRPGSTMARDISAPAGGHPRASRLRSSRRRRFMAGVHR